MKKEYLQEINSYTQLNKVIGECGAVFFGSSFMSRFPFGELCQLLSVENRIYNRSIYGLTIPNAKDVFSNVALPLKPKKIFINIGEEDLNMEPKDFHNMFVDLIDSIKNWLPKSEIIVLSVISLDPKAASINSIIESICKELKVNYVISANCFTDGNGNITSTFVDDKKQFTLISYISLWRTVYRYLRNSNLAYYDAFSIANAAMLA